MPSIREFIQSIRNEVVFLVTHPRTQLTRWQRLFRYLIDLSRHARRELRDHSAATMAAALTYRTIFGLVPMIVMALIVFRAFGGFAQSEDGIRNMVYDLLELQVEVAEEMQRDQPEVSDPDQAEATDQDPAASEPPAVAGTPDSDGGGSWFSRKVDQTIKSAAAKDPQVQAELESDRANAEMKARIDDLVSGLSKGASTISIGSIGVIGMMVLIWAALGLVVTVEKTFNVIYNAPSGRPWLVRVPIYWAIITLGPVLIWASYYFSAQLAEAAANVQVIAWLLDLLNHFTAVLVTWLLFLLLFKLMPNTHVAIRPAMIGAMVSALAWELMKAALRWYIENAVLSTTQTRLYGSLALIPLLLFWVYVTWIVVLAGLELTHILQTLPASRMGDFEEPKPAPATSDPWLVIPVLAAISDAFCKGKTRTVDQIADQLHLPVTSVADVTDALVKQGLLHRLDREDGAPQLVLAMPPDQIDIGQLIDSTHPEIAEDSPGYALLQQIAAAQKQALGNAKLGRAASTSG